MSAGVLINGNAWGRGQDALGVALARNWLSSEHRKYLEAGGLGFFIGDGPVELPAPETIVETFYSFNP